MKTKEVRLEPQTFVFNTNLSKKGSKNDIFLFQIGRAIPSTLSHLKRFKSLDVLNTVDAARIDLIFRRAHVVDLTFSKEADFKYTKSNEWVRLTNIDDFKEALTILIIKKPSYLMSI